MEPDLVGLGGPEAAALLGPDMDDRRAGQVQGPAQGLQQGVHVVAGHDPDVGEPQVLEQLARLGEVHHRLAQPPAPFERRRPDDRDPLDGAVVRALALPPGVRELDLREVLADRADRRADRHLVVVHDDEHLRLALADVVEGFERQAAHQRRIADDDRDALEAMADVARLGEAFGDRQAGAGVPAIEHVVLGLRAAREPAHPVELAQRPESVEAAGQQLVGVGLVAGVPDDPVSR